MERFLFLLPRPIDLLQILLVAAGLYYVLKVLARTRAMQMLAGLLVLVLVYFLARLLALEYIRYILAGLFQYGVIAALIVFHPELRAALSRLGRVRMLRVFNRLEEGQVADELVESMARLARAKIGAIVAVQREVGLEEYADTGTRLHARVAADLLISLFSPYSPLHDGAVLVEGDTIIAAGVILPLTQFPVADKSLGTRHRAALGLSEETDALVIVVSEETSQLSLAHRGRLERNIDLDRVRLALTTGVVQTPVPT
ncbi:MAG TPA: diadenylate cyclase CdaA [Longimicrobiales bacterium]|nr:diadenylate cyclase CdaA [Longimicrobiales bacterium]